MSPPVLYNEIEPYAADWIGNLVAAGHIAPGDVDTRSIVDLRPSDLAGRIQFHAFAGIAGWSVALRLAGWPDDVPVWTGSCPCQPFSAAGQRKGFDDERHLWPAWFRLIRECRPPVVFGEQVEAAVRLGWLDAVFADLEAEGYACGAVVLGAHSVGAPHIRQRLWFVAHARDERREGQHALLRAQAQGWLQRNLSETAGRGPARSLGDAGAPRLSERQREALGGEGRREEGRTASEPSLSSSPWAGPDWLQCHDGRARPTKPGLFPLAHGLSGRVGRLRAYGNAIVPQVAATFISAFMASLAEREAVS